MKIIWDIMRSRYEKNNMLTVSDINDILLRNSENPGGRKNEICKNRNGKR